MRIVIYMKAGKWSWYLEENKIKILQCLVKFDSQRQAVDNANKYGPAKAMISYAN